MKKIKTSLKALEKRKMLSKKPSPIIPFILAVIILILYFINPINNNSLKIILILLFIFTLVFAIIHLIINKILKNK